MRCKLTNKEFDISQAELDNIKSLYAAHPVLQKYDITLPDICGEEFLRQIGAWGNLCNLYKTKSSFSGIPQISRYNPDLGYKICTPEEFWSEKIDNTQSGRDYDFSKPFFKQFDELLKSVYLTPLHIVSCEGSDYVNGAVNAKNSYLSFGIFNCQDCLYSYMIRNCEDCIDCIESSRSRFCYDCHSIVDCYQCRHVKFCKGCQECILCEDCIGSRNCIFCFGLRNASYCIFNQQMSKDEYHKFVSNLGLNSRNNLKLAEQRFQKFLKDSGFKCNTIVNAENCSGEFISNCSNVLNSFYVHDAKDCGHIMLSNNCTDFWRGFSENAVLGYQSGAYFNAYCTYNSYMIVGGSFNLYSLFLYNSCENCFGSIGLNKKHYCILNKEYSKQEYFELLERIIAHMKETGEWGQFFPSQLAPHYLDDSFADEWLEKLDTSIAAKRGYRVRKINRNAGSVDSIKIKTPPDVISANYQEILSQHFVCVNSGKEFKFQKRELDFYFKNAIPLPELDWKERIKNRIAKVYLIKTT